MPRQQRGSTPGQDSVQKTYRNYPSAQRRKREEMSEKLLIYSVLVNLIFFVQVGGQLKHYEKEEIFIAPIVAAILFFVGYGILSLIGVL